MSNYTAGPWQLQNPEGLLSVQVVKQPDKCICTVYKLFFEDAEALANARLIAAAPDLLEALKQCEVMFRVFSTADLRKILPGTYKDILVALAKAEGD